MSREEIMHVGGIVGDYLTSVLLRLKIGLSSAELVQKHERVARNSMAIARMSGFEDATVESE
eukprot:9828950-Heterocapsa_arctica.AAC.1